MRGNLSDTVDPTEKYGEVMLLIILHGVLLLFFLINFNYVYD